MKHTLLSLTFSALLCGCAMFDEAPPSTPEGLTSISYTLYVSRASLTNTEFEQYKLLPAGLFSECGTIHRGRSETRQQTIEKVDSEKLVKSRELALELFETLSSGDHAPVDAPGANSGLADPGKYTLTVQVGEKRVDLKTSFDFVERQQTSLSSHAHSLTQMIRSMPSKTLCGNQDFYGIGRRS